MIWGVHSITHEETLSKFEMAPGRQTPATMSTYQNSFSVSMGNNEVWLIDLYKNDVEIITHKGNQFTVKTEPLTSVK